MDGKLTKDDGGGLSQLGLSEPAAAAYAGCVTSSAVAADLQRDHQELMDRARELPGVATALEVQRLIDEALPKEVVPLVAGVGYATGGNR